MKTFFLIIALLVYNVSFGFSQNVSGKVSDLDGALPGASVLLLENDSVIAACLSDNEGKFVFSNIAKSDYIISLSFIGYDTQIDTVKLKGNFHKEYQLNPKSISLNEISVTSDRSNIVKNTPHGSVYFLSSDAKKQKDVFNALQEIPKLDIDISYKSILLNDGSKPLILINGIERDKGAVSSIDPKDIEQIEIIEVPSAKYLTEGITSAINIKLKNKNSATYQYLNTGTVQNPTKLLFGVSDLSFDIGSNKYSFYFIGEQFFFNRNKSKSVDNQWNSSTHKLIDVNRKSNYNSYYFQVGGDYQITQHDYLLYSITYNNIPESYNLNGVGSIYNEDDIANASTFDYYKKYKMKFHINSYNTYYSHTFSNKNKIDVLFRFNLNGSQNIGFQEEIGKSNDYYFAKDFNFNNFKKSGTLNINYSTEFFNKHKFDFGYRLDYQWNKIDQKSLSIPAFHYKETNNYLYIDISKSINKIAYSASIGYNYTNNKSDDIKNDYRKIRYSAIISYNIDQKNRLTLSNNQYVESPAVSLLNPYNISTDSLITKLGNPLLEPITINNLSLSYSFRGANIIIEPKFSFKNISNYIHESGSMNEDVYVRTIINEGNFKLLQPSILFRYNFSFGYVSLYGAYNSLYFPNHKKNHSWDGRVNFNFRYSKLSLSGKLALPQKEYNDISKVKSSPESEANLAWSINDNWNVSIGSRWITGRKTYEKWTEDKDYSSYYSNRFNDRNFTLLLGVRYNFRNRSKSKHKTQKLYQEEKGIKLITD